MPWLKNVKDLMTDVYETQGRKGQINNERYTWESDRWNLKTMTLSHTV